MNPSQNSATGGRGFRSFINNSLRNLISIIPGHREQQTMAWDTNHPSLDTKDVAPLVENVWNRHCASGSSLQTCWKFPGLSARHV